jgi:hypothetical protein
MFFLKGCAFYVALLCCSTLAQDSRGTIGGRVSDPQDAGIPGVMVVITNIDTGVNTSLATNDKGVYVAPLLIPGNYQVAAEHTGFKRATRSNIALSVSDDLQIDVRLELGNVSDSITVVESAPVLDSSSASISMLLGTKEMTDLPIAHGNPYQLIALAPGTTFEGDMLLNRPYDPTHSVDYSMSGSASGTTDFTLDGVSNTTKGSSQGKVAAGFVPPVDAIGEVRIETNSFDARTGQSSGGVVTMSLRSGTNKLHGTGTFVKMSPSWFANNFFSNRSGAKDADFDYNRWNGSLNGPVVIPHVYNGKNRMFFMWAYEQLQDQRPRGGTTLTVPTAAERKGDFSELLTLGANYQIYNPFTRRPETGSTTRYRQDPFPGNIIPTSLLNPVALKVMEYFPLPLNSGTTADHRNNYPQVNSPETAKYYTHTGKVDFNLGNRDRLFVRGNAYVRHTTRNDYFQTAASGLTENYHPVGASLDEVHTFGGSLVLNVRYGYTRMTRQTDPLHGRGFDLTTLGFPKSLNDAISPDLREFPYFVINGYFNSLNTGEARFMDTHSLVMALTKVHGSHTVDFGFEYRAYRQNKYNGSTTRSGAYTFDPTWTRGPLDNSTTAPIGQGAAALLLGLPSSSSSIARNTDFAEESTVWMGYVQDNWRIRPNLTVTAGVRYELEGPLTERYARSVRGFDSTVVLPIEAAAQAAYAASYASNPTPELPPSQFRVRGGLLFAGVNGQPRELWNRDWNNFAPRVGVAWTFAKNTVLRTGYGIYFGALGYRRTDVQQNGFERSTSLVPTKDSGLSFYSTLSNPFPDGIQAPVGASLGAMTDVGNSINPFNPNPVTDYNQRWQISIQRQFRNSTLIEAAYVGNRSSKIEIDRDLNVVGNQNLSRSPFYDPAVVNYLSANVPNPFRGLPGVNGSMGTNNTITRESLLKPFPQFSAVNAETYQGYSWYHSLQMRGSRRIATTTFNATYTWAKNMLANGFLNPADPLPSRTISSADRRHRVTVAMLYELPFGKRGRYLRSVPRLVDAAIGGWQISTMYIYQSGQPLTWGDVIFFGDPADIATGPHTAEQWFNINAGFTRNSSTRPSNHYRTWPFRFANVRGDSLNNVDLSVNKRWRLNEKGADAQLRVDALNAFNHPTFATPQMDQFNSAFGQITATLNYARQVQVMARVSF